MRPSGVLHHPGAVSDADHVCWVYDDAADFTAAAEAYLAAGLAAGQRLMWIGEDLDDARRFPGADDLIDRGALRLVDVRSAYTPHEQLRPEQQLAYYDGATRRALEEGFTGLRVVADVTLLAADTHRAGLVRWEHVADEYVASGSGFSAMCAYDRGRLSDRAVMDVSSVHPSVHLAGAPAPPFRLWFDGGDLVLEGSVDAFSAGHLASVLAATAVSGPTVMLDLAGLQFIDAAGTRALALWAADLPAATTVRVVGAPRSFRKVWELLGYAAEERVTLAEHR